jgi:hypothetical protein
MPTKEVPVVIDFESPEYDAQFGDAQRADLLQGVLDYVLTRADEGINSSAARRSVIEDAVDSVLESSLVAIDMLYVERDDQVGTACKQAHLNSSNNHRERKALGDPHMVSAGRSLPPAI